MIQSETIRDAYISSVIDSLTAKANELEDSGNEIISITLGVEKGLPVGVIFYKQK